MLTDDIVSSVESVLARQKELPESTKDDISSGIASTLQSASATDCNLTKDELHALKRLKNDKNIVTLPPDKGRVTVVMLCVLYQIVFFRANSWRLPPNPLIYFLHV